MSNISPKEISEEFLQSKMGIAGIVILGFLILVSIIAAIAIPQETLKQWNNPDRWLSYPKTAVPIWINYFTATKIPEHEILDSANSDTISKNDVSLTTRQFSVDYDFDDFPNDFIYQITSQYSGSPLLQISVLRPDGIKLKMLSSSLPYSKDKTTYNETIFSTDEAIRKNLYMQQEKFNFATYGLPSERIIFSKTNSESVLKGDYVFLVKLYSVNTPSQFVDAKMIIGGKAFGIMGTDELRRDLAIGLLWGTPLALFIGLAVAIGSVIMGLVYGVYAGYKGKKTDEAMMRLNDVIYALPALPFLIILAVTISNSIFVMIGFLMIFGWVGIAKVSRSMAMQIKTRGYIQASEMMGQKQSKIIFRHILPQLLPYAFASIAISVPAAITTEAGLSFLGLGDPSFPTWGQILHDASVYGASSRGLWWWIMPPGVLIAITGLSFVFMGNALDRIVNPKLKR